MSRSQKLASVATAYDAAALTMRNKFINGGFDIWQRGTSFASAAGLYTADRWAGNNSTGAVSRQAFTLGQTDVPGNPKYFLRAVCTATNDGIRQRIEGVQTLAGGDATLSFYARVSSGTLNVTPRYSQVFGTGGSPSATVTADGSAKTLTTTWQRFTDTTSLASISGKTLGTANDDFLQVALIAAGAGTIEIADVQIEAGSVATPFERRPLQQELALCQRYLPAYNAKSSVDMVGNGFVGNATTAYFLFPYPVTPRVPPSGVTVSSPSHFSLNTVSGGGVASAITFSNGGDRAARISATGSSMTAGQGCELYGNTTSAQLLFTGCEL